jgi:hypothetical protein
VSAAGWDRVADDVRRFNRIAPGEAIDVVDEEVTRQLRVDTGGDGALSHGRTLGRADTRVTHSEGEAEIAAAGSMRVWGIIEGGTSSHTIDAGPGHVLKLPFGFRRRVTVRGVRARRTFTESCARGMERAARKLESDWSAL